MRAADNVRDLHELGKEVGDFATDKQQPTVCAIMLTRDRPEMAARAVRCFRAQTYENRYLLVLHNGDRPTQSIGWEGVWQPSAGTIGKLRNDALRLTQEEIIIHWDDDDWSHPSRIAEQVALLQSSGAQAVGYHDMLFWRTAKGPSIPDARTPYFDRPGREIEEAYLYSQPPGAQRYALGTSLCYWRSTWEREPFPDTSRGEDTIWQMPKALKGRGVEVQVTTSIRMRVGVGDGWLVEPRMIATIHGSNTCTPQKPHGSEWRRVPEWDERVRKTLEEA